MIPSTLTLTLQVDAAMNRLVSDLVDGESRVFRIGQANLRHALERTIYFALAGEKLLDPTSATGKRDIPFWVDLILPYLRGERRSFDRRLGLEQRLLREIYLRRGEADIEIAGIDAAAIDILFLVIQPKFVGYLQPIAERLGPRCAFLAIEDPQMFDFLTEIELPRVHVSLSAATKAQFAPSVEILRRRYTRGPFDDWPIRFNTIRGALMELRPRCIVIPEGNADIYEIVNQAAKVVDIPTFCIQQGWAPIVHPGFRNMTYTAMAVWGKGFAQLLTPHNPMQRFLVTGNHNIICRAQGDVERRTAIGFFLQNGAPWMTESVWGAMLDLIGWAARAFPAFEIRVREHPGQPLTPAELARISSAPNIRVMSPGTFGLDAVLEGCRVVVAMTSTTILEGAASGAVPLILNVNGLGPYSPDIVTCGAAIEVDDFEDARSALGRLAGEVDYVESFGSSLANVRAQFFAYDGASALGEIADAIDDIASARDSWRSWPWRTEAKRRPCPPKGRKPKIGESGTDETRHPPAKGTIYLVNQISSHGHLDMYARVYSKCLLDLGFDVTLVAERESGITEWIAAQYRGSAAFNFYSRSLALQHCDIMVERLPLHAPPPLWRRALRVLREESALVLADRITLYTRYYAGRVAALIVRTANRPAPGINLQPWIEDIQAAARKFEQSPSLVFFLYLDMISESSANRRALSRRLGTPWAGLLFHPRCLSEANRSVAERYFSVANCAGAAFLNPRAVPNYKVIYPGRTFVSLPDVTDAELPDADPDLVQKFRRRANGRTIVLAVGSIAPHKGVVGLIDVIRAADPSRYFFVIAGEIFWDSFGDERATLRDFCENPPENCVVHSRYIESERDVNAIIAASDVLYAVYRDFKDSSNSLTKASIFEKPLLVSEGYLMAERVRSYRLGAAVKFGDVSSIAAGLDEVRARPRSEFGFSAYREAHSLGALRERLAASVQAWLGCPLPPHPGGKPHSEPAAAAGYP